MSVYKVHRVFISILLFRLVYLLPVTIQAPLGSESLGTNLTQKALVAGAWTERKKMYHGGSFLKLADDNMDIQNPEAQNRGMSGF